MNSPRSLLIWQAFAQGLGDVFTAFAMQSAARHCFCAGHRQLGHDLRSHRCYPSPSLRSGPSQAGPTLVCQGTDHDCARRIKNCFESRDIAVESAAITTNKRGSFPCASRLSSSLFSRRPWRAACRTPHRAVWPVPSRARQLPMHSMKTSSRAPLWAGWLVQPPVASSWACRPAPRATEPLTDRAAYGRIKPTARTTRASRLGGPLLFCV
jgi:hypothetical protein